MPLVQSIAVSAATQIAVQLYNYKIRQGTQASEEAFRKNVLNQLSEIENELANIENVLNQLLSETAYNDFWNGNTNGNPIKGIETYYQSFSEGVVLDQNQKDIVCLVVINDINYIYEGTSNSEGWGHSAVELFINLVNSKSGHYTSVCELSYNYFKNVLLGNVLKGLAMLKYYGNTSYEKLTQEFTSGSDSYFIKMGQRAQLDINKVRNIPDPSRMPFVFDEIFWAGQGLGETIAVNAPLCNYGMYDTWPQIGAITGIEFAPNPESPDDLDIILYAGDLDKSGYVSKVETTRLDCTKAPNKMGMVQVSDPSNGGCITQFAFINCLGITVPDGYVVVGVGWDFQASSKQFYGEYDYNPNIQWTIASLVLNYAPVIDGKIDYTQVKQTEVPDLIDQVDIDFDTSSYASKANAPSYLVSVTDWDWKRWNTKAPAFEAPALWNVPLSGAYLNDGQLNFRLNTHVDSFGPGKTNPS